MDKSEYVLNGYTYELIKKVIEDECRKQEGFLRNWIEFQFDVLTESDFFKMLVEKLVKESLENVSK
tara:strand:- start:249 stop:446 length:198 start_codon:yes stop_codon:yes gene_type:complete